MKVKISERRKEQREMKKKPQLRRDQNSGKRQKEERAGK